MPIVLRLRNPILKQYYLENRIWWQHHSFIEVLTEHLPQKVPVPTSIPGAEEPRIVMNNMCNLYQY